MPVVFRNYIPEPLFGEDYYALRLFLLKLGNHNYPFGRWDWMITHGYLDEPSLAKIGFWEDEGVLIALATYDTRLGTGYLMALPGYQYLREELLLYGQEALVKEGKFKTPIMDGDREMQEIAASHGYTPTQDKEEDAVFYIDDPESISYTLPPGYSITSMAETYDLYKYGQALWKGFNHEERGEGTFQFDEEIKAAYEVGFQRPNCNLDIKIAVVAPNGDFVSYCGMWQDPAISAALVEPVATDPAYRRLGLGRAAVLEGVRRVGLLGADRAFVGSSQQFYYSIGFKPYSTSTYWARRQD